MLSLFRGFRATSAAENGCAKSAAREGSAASAAGEGHAQSTQRAAMNEASDDFGWAQGEGSVALRLGVQGADEGCAHHRFLGVCTGGVGVGGRGRAQRVGGVCPAAREKVRVGGWSQLPASHTRISAATERWRQPPKLLGLQPANSQSNMYELCTTPMPLPTSAMVCVPSW